MSRRPLASRNTRWAQRLTHFLLRTPVTPSAISVAGLVLAGLGGLAFAFAPRQPALFLFGALMVQFRLLCNLLDGMVAVEGGRGSATGVLFNELPDRFEDSFLLIGFAYATPFPELGYVAALLAVLTAYLRAFGASLGQGQDFRGPMAKPQRMAALTAGAFLAFVESSIWGTAYAATLILALIVVGTSWTAARRTQGMASKLRQPH